MNFVTLQDGDLTLKFNPENGSLVGVQAGEWTLLDQPELGLSFRLMLPFHERRNNQIYGNTQTLTSYKLDEEAKRIEFVWDTLTSPISGTQPVKITATVQLANGQAIFSMNIDNDSDYVVENVYYPYFGNVTQPEDSAWLKTYQLAYSSGRMNSLRPKYANLVGYYGSDYPVQHFCDFPNNPFVLLMGEHCGLYIGTTGYRNQCISWHTELHPGWEDSMFSLIGEKEIGPEQNAVRFAACHLPFIQPHVSTELTPIVIQPYCGGWQQGSDIYKKWRQENIKDAPLPKWVKEPHSWIQIQMNSPEGEFRYKYKDLVEIGKDCAKHGVKAIQLTGWNDGGQDQNNPSHKTDDHLGTFEELRDAIKQVQEMGVKVILFTKFTWADRATEWYRKDLHRLAVKDPYGDPNYHNGYAYQTASQFMDISTKRFIPMCFLSEEYLEICNREFQRCLDLGPDGILFDECLGHGPTKLCFDPNHGHPIGAHIYANDRKLIHNFAKIANNPEFLYAGEANYDLEFEAYHVSYHRTEDPDHIPYMRYIVPHQPIITVTTGFNDRNMINQCLMYNYIVSYEPYNFKGRLDDFPMTIEYGKKMDKMRAELRDYFWDGTYQDVIGATVTESDGTAHEKYSVFHNDKNDTLGLVVCNYEMKKDITVSVAADNGQQFTKYRLIDDETWYDVKDGIRIPARSAAVVL